MNKSTRSALRKQCKLNTRKYWMTGNIIYFKQCCFFKAELQARGLIHKYNIYLWAALPVEDFFNILFSQVCDLGELCQDVWPPKSRHIQDCDWTKVDLWWVIPIVHQYMEIFITSWRSHVSRWRNTWRQSQVHRHFICSFFLVKCEQFTWAKYMFKYTTRLGAILSVYGELYRVALKKGSLSNKVDSCGRATLGMWDLPEDLILMHCWLVHVISPLTRWVCISPGGGA